MAGNSAAISVMVSRVKVSIRMVFQRRWYFFSCRVWLRPSQRTDRTNKPVVFYGPIAPPVPNAPNSVCPRASITACRCAAGSIRISCRASCCCSSAIAGIAIGANFKIYLLRQFCSNRVKFCYNTQETQTQKQMNQNFEIWISWFLRIFWNFQKGVARSLCGRSGPLWSRPNVGSLWPSFVKIG